LDWKVVVPLVEKLIDLQDEEEGTFRLTEESKEGSPYYAGILFMHKTQHIHSFCCELRDE
jgi:hypothetical protein